MQLDNKYFIGRDSKGTFKWNEKELIYIKKEKIQKDEESPKTKNTKRSSGTSSKN